MRPEPSELAMSLPDVVRRKPCRLEEDFAFFIANWVTHTLRLQGRSQYGVRPPTHAPAGSEYRSDMRGIQGAELS
jgi:hypothetical protein